MAKKIISALVALIMTVSVFAACGGSGSSTATVKGTISSFGSALNAKSAKRLSRLMASDYLVKQHDMTMEEVEEMCEEIISDYTDEYGENCNVKLKVISEDYKKGDELEEIAEDLELEIQSACEAEVEFSIKSKEREETDTDRVRLIKYQGRWYIVDL